MFGSSILSLSTIQTKGQLENDINGPTNLAVDVALMWLG
jgi:hypothetical protein